MQERRGWIIVAVLFCICLLVYGAAKGSAGVFVAPLSKQYGWNRTQVSLLLSLLTFLMMIAAPGIGWLLDRIEARTVLGIGVFLTSIGLLGASQVTTYPEMLAAYTCIGLGVAGCTILPCSVVAANWIETRRGLAVSIALAGMSASGAVMTLVASKAIAWGGVEAGYIVVALPMLAIIPIIFWVVRTRPNTSATVSVKQAGDALPGFEVAAALRNRSFWLVLFSTFITGISAGGANLHLVPYLTDLGFSAGLSALVMSLVFISTSIGKLFFGWVSDRITARITLALTLSMTGAGLILLIVLHSTAVIVPFLLLFGSTFLVPTALIPVAAADSMGLKRFGSIGGFVNLAHALGLTVGPLLGGILFDGRGSYTLVFVLYTLFYFLGAVAILGTKRYGEQSEVLPAAIKVA